jgi:anaerobic ribonucleoside-triphosphate reductase activating protein
MLIQWMLRRSTVNGPGARAVVWLQGCDLRWPGCLNPATHDFDRDRDKTVEEVAERILACEGIDGVTFSGGEPFQQAADLRQLCEYIKLRRPDLSIGVFSGYTLQELLCGRWHWKGLDKDGWINGDRILFEAIKQFLDFGVFGRFRRTLVCTDKPLCGSRNQEVVFFSNRYAPRDLVPQAYEVTISEDGGSAIITGFPPPNL